MVWAHVRGNRLRAALTSCSVALAVFLFCTLQTILTTLESFVTGASGNRLIASSAVSLFQLLPLASVEKIRAARVPGLLDVGHWTWFDGIFRGDAAEFFPRFAIDVAAFRRQYGDWSRRGADYELSEDEWTRFLRGKNGCIVGRGLADRYGIRRGDALTLEGTIFPGTYAFTVEGIYATHNPTYDEETLFFHWQYMNEQLRKPDVIGILTLNIEDAALGPEICRQVDDLFRNSSGRTLTQPEAAFQAQFLSMWGNVGLLFQFIGGAVIFATFMITLNTMLLSVNERVREIGVLKTLGFTRHAMRALYLTESFVLCGGGAVLGVLIASGMWHGQPLRLGTLIFPTFGVAEETRMQALLLGGALALSSGIAPAIVAARLSIVRALREA